MLPGRRHLPMIVWAAREIQRRPGRSLLLFAALAGLVFMVGTALLFSQALTATWSHLLERSPDLIVRRVDAGGWAPLPVDEALATAKQIPGVLDPTPRLWGVAAAGDMPVTVVTAADAMPADDPATGHPPEPGQAMVGRALLPAIMDGRLTLTGRATLTVSVQDTFPADTGLATHDLVWMAPSDARRLLGIPNGYASDLAIRVFRREEVQALGAELATAFPWPVAITDRDAHALHHHTRAVRTGTLAMVAGIPATMAMLLLVADTLLYGGRSPHYSLLRAMGWATTDLLRLQVAGATMIGLPAITLGLTAAYTAVFWSPVAGITALWLTGGQHLPALVLSRDGILLVLLEIAAMVGLPYLAAVFLTTFRAVTDDVGALNQAAPWD